MLYFYRFFCLFFESKTNFGRLYRYNSFYLTSTVLPVRVKPTVTQSQSGPPPSFMELGGSTSDISARSILVIMADVHPVSILWEVENLPVRYNSSGIANFRYLFSYAVLAYRCRPATCPLVEFTQHRSQRHFYSRYSRFVTVSFVFLPTISCL